MSRNGNGGSNGTNGHDAPDALSPAATRLMADVRAATAPAMDRLRETLDKRMLAFEDTARETIGENLKLFRQLLTMAEDMAREHSERMQKISTPIIDQLEKQHHEIAALKRRLDAVEARQAEAEKPEP